MNADVILREVADLARTKLDWHGAVEPSMRLVEDLKLDSIQLLTLAMEVEDRFRICLDEDDEDLIHTVADLVNLIQKKSAQEEEVSSGTDPAP